MIVRKVNPLSGRYVEDVFIGDDPPVDVSTLSPIYIVMPIPESFKSPRWDGEQWVDDFMPFDVPGELSTEQPTVEARLSAVEAAILDMITGW